MAKTQTAEIGALLAELVEAHFDGSTEFDYKSLNGVSLSLRIKGKSWGGVVNKTVARFVLNAEREIQKLCEESGIDLPDSKHGFIQIEIEEGSLLAFLNLDTILENAEKMGMDSGDLILIISSLAVLAGILKASEIIGKCSEAKLAKIKGENEVEKEKIRSEERLKIVGLLAPVEKSERNLEAPLRGLVGKMDKGDTIEIDGKEPLSKAEITKNFTKSVRAKPELYHIDHVYIVENLKTEEGKPWEVKIRYGDRSFPAILKLDILQQEEFVAGYGKAGKSGKVAADLHVTAKVSRKGVSKAEVVGLGKPRETAIKLSKALAERAKK
jgi:hypothetical protein